MNTDIPDLDRTAESKTCPRCSRPAEKLIAGVCPACKALCKSTHAKILKPGYSAWKEEKTASQPGPEHYADGAPAAITDDDVSGEEWLNGLCRDFAMNQETMMELVARVANHLGDTGKIAIQEEFSKWRDLTSRLFILRDGYVANNGDANMATRTVWLLLGFPELAQADCLAKLVRHELNDSYTQKQARAAKSRVNKCLQFFQSNIPELPILPGQRDDDARFKMQLAQIKIWHTNPKNKPQPTKL